MSILAKEVQFTVKIDGESRTSLFEKLLPLGFLQNAKRELIWSTDLNFSVNPILKPNESQMSISSGNSTGNSEFFTVIFKGELDGCQAIMHRFFDSFEKFSIKMVQYKMELNNHSFKSTVQAIKTNAQSWNASDVRESTGIFSIPFPAYRLACILAEDHLLYMTRGLANIKQINSFIAAIEGDYNSGIDGFNDIFAPRKPFNIFTFEQFEKGTLF